MGYDLSVALLTCLAACPKLHESCFVRRVLTDPQYRQKQGETAHDGMSNAHGIQEIKSDRSY